MIASALAFVLSPIGRVISIGLLLIAAATYLDQRGAARERAKCRAAAIQAQLDAQKVDLDAAKRAAEDSERAKVKIEADYDAEKKKVDDYEARLKSRPACLLDDDDVRSLGGVREPSRRRSR